MIYFRFILPAGGVLDLDFRTVEQAAAHADYLDARFYRL